MRTDKLTRVLLEQSQAMTGRIVLLAIEAKRPTLKGQIDITVDFMNNDFFFRARKGDGGHVKLMFGIGAMHPRFKEMVVEAQKACDAIRFNQTSAVEVRK